MTALLGPPVTTNGASTDLVEPPSPVSLRERITQLISASILIVAPIGLVIFGVVHFWHGGVSWFDVALGVTLYFVTGHGLSAGFHRLFTHRSFVPCRWLKIALGVAGSMAVEGSLITWVAQHRRHHAGSDRAGDPHSPIRFGRGLIPQCRGLLFAHIGWLFVPNPSHPERWCPDVLADPDLVRISRLAPAWSVLSFALPFALGYAVTGTFTGALGTLLWAGVVRIFLLHHVTWGVNSIAHTFGSRPFVTKDNSRNVAWLAIASFGDSWHNAHHAFPTLARHGVDRFQIDSTAGLIRLCERFGWATGARWPVPERIELRRAR